MSASPFDSALYRDLFGDAEVAKLLSDGASIRAMMLVMGTLAKVQGAAGVIPEVSGLFLHRAAMELQIDPGGLAKATGRDGVTVPGLVAAFRAELNAPDHAQYLHWGATSQDIQDSAQSLRLRQILSLIEARLRKAALALADLAEAHADTPQAARTYGQVAVPSSFGALVAKWGWPVLRLLDRLPDLRRHALAVSLSGAAGTASQLGPDPFALRAALADALGLADPGHSWHAERNRIVSLADWCADTCAAGGPMGEDLLRLTRSGAAELALSGVGSSSTMPQKENPVAPSVLLALARSAPGLLAPLRLPHGEARDGAAWFTEWLCLPALAAAAGRTSMLLRDLPARIQPDPAAMAAPIIAPPGLLQAEALSFALASEISRSDAQAEIKRLAAQARSSGQNLTDLVAEAHPDVPLPPSDIRGTAPAEARAFAAAARVTAAD
ncbi:lyase family protein [Gymnodinialimonas sp. 2305UL16-5]|uniref:lyase family protein n=1 Tax=Gymnodinialimonas mytili TaxID=3126503 RepID=UPI0030B0A1C5